MRSRVVTCLGATGLIAALAGVGQPAVQAQQQARYPYVLVDLGTVGGPQSNVLFFAQTLNNQGMVGGAADTASLDPYASNPYPFLQNYDSQDTYLQHAILEQKGVTVDLGTLPGRNNSSAVTWINQGGDAAGTSENGSVDPTTLYPEADAVLWRGGHLTNLGALPGGNESLAAAVNNRDQVVGISSNATLDPVSFFGWGTQTRAFLWQDGIMRDLGTLGGPDSLPAGINDRGQVAGFSYTNATVNPVTGGPTIDPFLWTDGHMQDLGTLGGTQGYVNALNNRGEVVGQSNLAGDQSLHPFLWDGRTLRDLGTLGGANGVANWINDAGAVVGWANTSTIITPPLGEPGNQVYHAFLWRQGVQTDLGAVAGKICSTGYGVNIWDQVVGASGLCHGAPGAAAFLWQHGSMLDLNSLIAPSAMHLTYGLSINDRGEIAGRGVLANGNVHAVLLIPTAEALDEGITANSPLAAADGPVVTPRVGTGSCADASTWRVRLANWRRSACPGA